MLSITPEERKATYTLSKPGLTLAAILKKFAERRKGPVAAIIVGPDCARTGRVVERFQSSVGVADYINANILGPESCNTATSSLKKNGAVIVRLSGEKALKPLWISYLIKSLEDCGAREVYVMYVDITLRELFKEFKPSLLVECIQTFIGSLNKPREQAFFITRD